MANGEINATDLTEETTSTLSGNEQFVMFDPVEGKRADIDEVAKYIAGDKSQLQTSEKSSVVGAINEVNGKAADLKEDLLNSLISMRNFDGMGNFDHYGFDTSGAFIQSQKYRVSNNDKIILDYDITVSVANGFKWGYLYFTSASDSTGTYYGWYNSTSIITIPKGTYFQIQIARVSEIPREVANVNEFLNAVTLNTSEKVCENTIGLYSPILFGSSDFVNGTWESDGNIHAGTKRICTTKLYPVFKGNTFTYLPETGLDIGFGYYNEKSRALVYFSGWLTGITEQQKYIFTENGRFFVQYKKTVGGTMSPSDFGGIATLDYGISGSLTALWENAITYDSGSNKYIGEKIPSRINSFNCNNIFTMSYDVEQTAQDIDIFGNYMFVAFSSVEQIKVYTLTDYSLVASMNVETIHGSSIQFSNEYYDADDEFPLLYVGGWQSNRINVIRITVTNNTWSATVVKTLYIPTTYGYYASPNIDKDNNILYTYAHSNNSLPNTEQMVIASWDLNNLTNNGDGTYTPKSLGHCMSPSVGTYQGHKYYGGRIYITSSSRTAPWVLKMFAIDCGSGEIVTTIDMSSLLSTETEGLCYRINGDVIEWYISETRKVYRLDF